MMSDRIDRQALIVRVSKRVGKDADLVEEVVDATLEMTAH